MYKPPESAPPSKKAKIQTAQTTQPAESSTASSLKTLQIIVSSTEGEMDKPPESEPPSKKSKIQAAQTSQPAESSTASSLKTLKIIVSTTEGKMIELDVKASDTVDQLKNQIQTKMNIPLWKIDLMHEGYQLENDNWTLSDLDISDGDKIDLATTVQVTVRTISGALINKFYVSPFSSCWSVKFLAVCVHNNPLYRMSTTNLIMGTDYLHPDSPMSHYNVEEGSELTLVVIAQD